MIKIFTDTTSSLTFAEYEKYGINGVPLYINQGEISRKELFEISYDEFYKKQREGIKFTTSQPTPHDFIEAFQPALEAGAEVICILLSGLISGSVNSARLAVEMLNTDRVSVVDSKQSGFGQAMMAIKAKELADGGLTRPEIVKVIEDQQQRTRVYFLVESLRYLHEGGRLSGAQALIGSIIQIKPIIWFNGDGKMEALEKIRTLKAAKARILELIGERSALGVEKIALHYADNLDEATAYAQDLEEIAGMPVPLVKLSPVVGAHTGPDILGPCIITK